MKPLEITVVLAVSIAAAVPACDAGEFAAAQKAVAEAAQSEGVSLSENAPRNIAALRADLAEALRLRRRIRDWLHKHRESDAEIRANGKPQHLWSIYTLGPRAEDFMREAAANPIWTSCLGSLHAYLQKPWETNAVVHELAPLVGKLRQLVERAEIALVLSGTASPERETLSELKAWGESTLVSYNRVAMRPYQLKRDRHGRAGVVFDRSPMCGCFEGSDVFKIWRCGIEEESAVRDSVL